MKHTYKCLIIIFLAITASGYIPVIGQEGLIRGKAVDSGTGKAVEYTYVLNYSFNQSIYGNSSGEFALGARLGDTLVFYAVGYYYQKVIVSEDMLGTSHVVSIPMVLQPYELTEARIIGLGSYGDFKQQFISLDLPKTERDKLADYLADISRTEAIEAYNKAKSAQGGSIVAAPILTPEEKERIKLAGIIEEEKTRNMIYQKYNPRVIKSVTGLTNDDEIIGFMVFCNFTDDYLLGVNEYDLMTRIALKFELFKRKKVDQESMENPVNQIQDAMYPNA